MILLNWLRALITWPRERWPQSWGLLGRSLCKRAILQAKGGSRSGELKPSHTLASIKDGNFASTSLNKGNILNRNISEYTKYCNDWLKEMNNFHTWKVIVEEVKLDLPKLIDSFLLSGLMTSVYLTVANTMKQNVLVLWKI